MKIIIRLMLCYIIIGHFVVFIIAPYSSKGVEVFQVGDWVILIWGSLYIFSIFLIWGYFFYHWGTNEFNNKKTKRVWFWVILFGGLLYFLGPIAYYLVVYERGKGLRMEKQEK